MFMFHFAVASKKDGYRSMRWYEAFGLLWTLPRLAFYILFERPKKWI
jgi:hypothetical protein